MIMIKTGHIQTDLLNEPTISYCLIQPTEYHKTLYWLHGYKERFSDILSHSQLEQMAEKFQIAIVIPNLPDTYYLDQPWNNCYAEYFFFEEFLSFVQTKHALPAAREATFIAGISMGGFGSLLYGSHHPEKFGKIACISGAFIIDDLLIGNPEVIGSPEENLTHFQNIFGDIPSLDIYFEESQKRNPLAAALKALEQKQLPPIFMACGKSDLLYTRNVKLREQLMNVGADITWKEASGNHDWRFFNGILETLFLWLS